MIIYKFVLWMAAAFIFTPVYANDNAEFVNQLKSNANNKKCLTLSRIIKSSTTIDMSQAIRWSIEFQSDCAYQVAKEFDSLNPVHANDAYAKFLLREGFRMLRPSPDIDGGIYNEWGKTTTNAIEQGLLKDSLPPDWKYSMATYMFARLSSVCAWGGNIAEAMQIFLHHGADPDAEVWLNFINPAAKPMPRSTARILISKNCPSLGYLIDAKR